MGWLGRSVLTVIAVLVLVVGALLLLPGEKLARIAAEQIEAETGRKITFGGDVKLTFWPVLGVETGPVVFANADWSKAGPMLTANSLAIGVSAPDLLKGSVRVERLSAQNPVLRLETKGSQSNWDLGPRREAEAGSAGTADSSAQPVSAGKQGSLGGVAVEQLTLDGARLIFIRDGRVEMDQDGLDLTAQWPEPGGPLHIDLAAPRGGDRLDLSATIMNAAALAEGRLSDAQVSMRSAGGTVTFDGKLSNAGDASGKFAIEATDTRRLLAALGQGGVDIPAGLGRKAKLQARITYTVDGRLSLRELRLDLDGNKLAGDADVTLAAKPRINARLQAKSLDFAKVSGSSGGVAGGSGGGSAGSSGWSRTPIDASALALVDGDIALAAGSVALSDLSLGETHVALSIDRSRAVLKLEPVSVFGGRIRGQLVANNRNGLSVGGDLTASDIEMARALPVLTGMHRFSGLASGRLKFLGVGQSEDEIMRSLSGSGSIGMGQGAISGLDLHRLMDGDLRHGGTTVFNSLSASFTIEKGNLDNQDLLLTLKNYRADGKGRIGIGARDIDYLFTPVALRANSGKGRSIPIRIVGPWADPKIHANLAKALEAAAEAELGKVGKTAKDALHGKLGEELGTTVKNSGDAEKAIKNKLEEEAKKGLLKLFGAD